MHNLEYLIEQTRALPLNRREAVDCYLTGRLSAVVDQETWKKMVDASIRMEERTRPPEVKL